jgi:hypothetical protein
MLTAMSRGSRTTCRQRVPGSTAARARPPASLRAVQVRPLQADRLGPGQLRERAPGTAHRRERLAQEPRAVVLADAADRGVRVQHLLDERGAAAGQGDHHGEVPDRLRLRREPAAAREQLALRAHRREEALEIEGHPGRGMRAARQVERLAVAAGAVEHPHGLESGDAPHGGRARGIRHAAQGRDRRIGVGLRAGARRVQREPLVLRPRAGLANLIAQLVRAARDEERVAERHPGLERERAAAVGDRAQARHGRVHPRELLVGVSAQEGRALVARGDALRRLQVHGRRVDAPELHVGARAREPRVHVAPRPRAQRVRGAQGLVRAAGREQALDLRRCAGIVVRHARRVAALSAPPPAALRPGPRPRASSPRRRRRGR